MYRVRKESHAGIGRRKLLLITLLLNISSPKDHLPVTYTVVLCRVCASVAHDFSYDRNACAGGISGEELTER